MHCTANVRQHNIGFELNLYKIIPQKISPVLELDGRLLLSGFEALITLTLTLDRVVRQYRHASLIELYLHIKCH